MLKVLLLYFSGTGITRHFTSLIQEEMEKRDYDCDVINIEEIIALPTLWQKKPVALHYTIRAETKHPLSKYPWPYLDLREAIKSAKPNPDFAGLANDWSEYDLIGSGSPVYAFRRHRL